MINKNDSHDSVNFHSFWQYTYNKRILLTSPTNLIAAMKLVHDLWKKDGISRNANDIAERAVKIYEKLAFFIEDFENVGSQLDKAAVTFQEAKKETAYRQRQCYLAGIKDERETTAQ